MIIRHLTREYLDFFGDGFSHIYFVLFSGFSFTNYCSFLNAFL